MLNYIKYISISDVGNHFFERDVPLGFEPLILFLVPGLGFQFHSLSLLQIIALWEERGLSLVWIVAAVGVRPLRLRANTAQTSTLVILAEYNRFLADGCINLMTNFEPVSAEYLYDQCAAVQIKSRY